MSLFSTSRQQQSSNLLEFRAGKMFTRGGGETGTPIMVHPDKRKGMVYISQSDDALMHFCWKDRTTGTVEDDLIVFPDDVEFIRVDQCTTGRVFLLKFKNSPRKLFFWMQEPKADKDEEFRRKVNELLNNPPTPGSMRGGRGGGGQEMDQFAQLLGLGGSGGGASEERMDLQNALAGMDQQQLMQLLNLMGSGSGGPSFGSFMDSTPPAGSAPRRGAPASAAAAAAVQPAATSAQPAVVAQPTTGPAETVGVASDVHESGAAASGRAPADQHHVVQVTDLRNILANLGGPVSQQPSGEAAVDLEMVLTARNVEESVKKSENEARLLTHLPDEDPVKKNREELLLTIRSPQFRQAVDMFGTALQTGQLAPLMSQFGLPQSAVEACARGDIQSVAEILEREAGASGGSAAAGTDKDKKKKEDGKGSDPPSKKDKQDDEGMDLD